LIQFELTIFRCTLKIDIPQQEDYVPKITFSLHIQIRDIFQAAGLAQETYRKTMDQTLSYMKSLNLPKEIQDKVRMWFTYNWETSKTLGKLKCQKATSSLELQKRRQV